MSPKKQKPTRLRDEFAKALKLQDKSERTVKTYVNKEIQPMSAA